VRQKPEPARQGRPPAGRIGGWVVRRGGSGRQRGGLEHRHLFEAGEADLGVICGLPYIWLADRHPAPVEAAGCPGAGRRPLRRPPSRLPGRDRPARRPDHLPGGAAGPLLHGFIQRFAPVDDAAYDDIRGM
jgi:arsenate reductase (thioredoxin)